MNERGWAVVMLVGGLGCSSEPAPDPGAITFSRQPTPTLVGQTLPAFEVSSTASDRVLLVLEATSATIPKLADDVLGTLEKSVDGRGTATFDDVVIKRSGTYVFVASKADGTLRQTSEPFEVTVLDPATVDCTKDGPTSAANRQNQRQGVQLIDDCTVIRGGGEPVTRAFGDVTCTGDVGTAAASVVVSWTGADVPAASATLRVPAAVAFAALPATHPRAQPLELPFTGGVAGNEVLVAFDVAEATGSFSIQCVADAGTGRVVIPARVFAQLAPNAVVPRVLSYSLSRRTLGDFDARARVDGEVSGGGTPVQLQ